jgi:AmiR/NasT family two-component response regulator
MTSNGSSFEHTALVAQAQGIVSVQADCSMTEALRRMKERALQIGQTLEEVAIGVIGHRIWFREGEVPPES